MLLPNGGMNPLVSDYGEPNESSAQEKTPLAGPKLDIAIKAMESAGFLEKLTARIMKLAAAKGFYSPFDGDHTNLPGGKSVGDLAGDIVEKALDGTYTWDERKHPDFYRFCWSRAESILTNWLDKNRRMTSMSPILEDGESDRMEVNAVNSAVDVVDIYELIRFKSGGTLGDQLLEDFALSLPDKSPEQAIVLATYDDRECVSRAYCRGKLSLSEEDFDAAMKRVRRAAPAFLASWARANKINDDERKELR